MTSASASASASASEDSGPFAEPCTFSLQELAAVSYGFLAQFRDKYDFRDFTPEVRGRPAMARPSRERVAEACSRLGAALHARRI